MSQTHFNKRVKSTTVIAVEHNGSIAIGADGQATLGNTVVKSTVKKIRSLADGKIWAGFAGSTADAFALLERLQAQIKAKAGNLYRAALSLAKEWRTDRYLRKLESMMVVIDQQQILILTGGGDVMQPDNGIATVGSGSAYAQAAALSLKKYASHLTAMEIVKEALHIAADICIYTNHNIVVETINKVTSSNGEGDLTR
ncbi:MAG: ATP-dependent protease subunit HslV [Bacteroidota bacterium]